MGKLKMKDITPKQLFEYWKLDENTMKFTGHTIALWPSDDYLGDAKKTIATVERIQLYAHSLMRYELSPYIYPIWGLGGLPEGFSRLAAVHGGVYMLRRPVKKINYGEDGKVVSVETTEGTAKLKKGGKLIGDPSYFKDTLEAGKPKIKKVGQVARWLCILKQPVPNTGNKGSCQIIIPHSAMKPAGKSNIYISVMSNALKVAPQGYYTAMISAKVFTANPKKELEVAYKLLGPVEKDFFFLSDSYMPINDPRKDNVFIPSSMDASTHFESATREVQQLYRLITGKAVDLSQKAEDLGKEDE